MNFDENPGGLYYTAWAQRLDGTWHMDISTGSKESKEMTFLGIILIAGIFSCLAVFGKNLVMSIVAAGSWMGIVAYMTLSPPDTIPIGGNVQGIIIVVMTGAAMGLVVNGVMRFDKNRKENNAERSYYSEHPTSAPSSYVAYQEGTRKSNHEETLEEYRARMDKALYPHGHPVRRRRNY